MPRITKGMIAAAYDNINIIQELAKESHNGPHACYQYHARSVNNYIEVLKKAGKELPEWVVKNSKYLKAMGWNA